MPSHRHVSGQESQREHGGSERGVVAELERDENLPGGVSAERALGVVMCVLERALSPDAVQRLERGLPASLRKLIARCEAHAKQAANGPRTHGEFVRAVAEHLELARSQAQDLTRAVFHAVHRLMSVGEVQGFAQELPEPLRDLWTAGDDRGASVQSARS